MALFFHCHSFKIISHSITSLIDVNETLFEVAFFLQHGSFRKSRLFQNFFAHFMKIIITNNGKKKELVESFFPDLSSARL